MRVADWPERLAALLEERRHAPFAYGTQDCATFAAAAVEAVTGERRWEPPYSTEREALRLMGGDLVGAVGDVLGAAVTPSRARRGDLVVLLADDGRQVLGVCIGERAAAPALDGLVFPPMSQAVAAWRID